MRKKYPEDTQRMVLDMVRKQKMKRREIAEDLEIEPEEVDLIYNQALKTFGRGPRKVAVHHEVEEPKQVIQRPPAVYSNRSAYGIAINHGNP